MSQNNQNTQKGNAGESIDDIAAAAAQSAGAAAADHVKAAATDGAQKAAAAVPSTPAASHTRKKFFGAGLVTGIAAGAGGLWAWQRWGGNLTSN